MAKLLSGATLRRGGSGEYIDLAGAMPQLPETPTTSTGYTLITNSLLQTTYASSLGNLEFYLGKIYSNIPNQNIELMGTGTGFVYISSSTESTASTNGALVVAGGVGINGTLYTAKDVNVNGLTIGQGYEGINNIVIRGTAKPQINEFNNGQQSIAIGYDVLGGIQTSYKTIAIGRYAAQSGTDLTSVIAIGDSALRNIGIIKEQPIANISSATQTSPVVITANNHGISTGTEIIIRNVVGMTQLNNLSYFVKAITPNTLELYSNNILSIPVNGIGYSAYDSDGTIYRILEQDNNIAIGEESGSKLFDGKDNFFLGYKTAKNMTTGSYNFILGHEVGSNMITGNANISIGGDNLVDGKDNQINIGSVLYYNGSGYLQLNADTGLGLDTAATATIFAATITSISQSIPATVASPNHGLMSGEDIIITDVVGMTEVNNQVYYVDKLNDGLFALYTDISLSTATAVNSLGFGSYVSGGTISRNQYFGALVVQGGLAVTKNALIKSQAVFADETNTTGTMTGAVIVSGGMYIAKDLYVDGNIIGLDIGNANNIIGGDAGSLLYQLAPNDTEFLPIGELGTVLISDGTYPSWQLIENLVANTATNALNIFIGRTETNVTYYLPLADRLDDNSPIVADETFYYDTANYTLYVQNINANSMSIGNNAVATTATFIAGDDISIDPIGNQYEINNISTLQSVTARGATTTNVVYFNNDTEASATGVGSVVVAGGISVAKRIKSESLRIEDTVFDSTVSTSTTVSATLIDVYSLADYRASKYLVQIDEGTTTSTARFQMIELLVLASNTGTAFMTQYASVYSHLPLGSFNSLVENVGGQDTVKVYFTAIDTVPKTIKVLRTAMTV